MPDGGRVVLGYCRLEEPDSGGYLAALVEQPEVVVGEEAVLLAQGGGVVGWVREGGGRGRLIGRYIWSIWHWSS